MSWYIANFDYIYLFEIFNRLKKLIIMKINADRVKKMVRKNYYWIIKIKILNYNLAIKIKRLITKFFILY